MRTRLLGGVLAAFVAAGTGAPAAAVSPPDIEAIPLTTPDDPAPAPLVPMRQRSVCATSATLQDSTFERQPPANVAFDVNNLHSIATGKGVTVAVIDSGVSPNARLPRLAGEGDYIGTTHGLEDCDHHGTLVAGIIAAAPSPSDGFVGVAPDANLISIRQTSAAYEPENRDGQNPPGGSSTLSTLAKAVVHAANKGAKVINLSVTACFPQDEFVDTSDIAAALKYAVDGRDAVVITSAGNSDSQTCTSNAQYDPTNASDPRNWSGVSKISMPSFYSPLVLSVGGTTLTGTPYTGTMAGPWVSVGAPAVDIVSLDPTKGDTGGLTNATVGDDGPRPITGTSFASAYVAGLAALIRGKHPNLSAREVRDRIINTAHATGDGTRNYLGAGVVDPIAALTYQTADVPVLTAPPSRADNRVIAEPHPNRARNITIGIVVSGCVLAVLGGWCRTAVSA
ncbi:type VII secretion-associated serine protease mycosin [Rhodococcus sp. WS4]|nr:type VII secretion-associated serine protease mycosin [Rhodococcus sp. WS4]